MMNILIIREKVKSFLVKCNGWERILFKFALTFAALFLLNNKLGYNTFLNSYFVVAGLSLVCAFTPNWMISTVVCISILGHFFVISPELTVLTAILLLLMELLYFSFRMGNGWVMVLSMILGCFDMEGAMLGVITVLPYGFTSVIPVCFGMSLSALICFVNKNFSVLFSSNSTMDMYEQLEACIQAIFSNETLLILIIAIVLAMIFICFLRRLCFAHSWYISLVIGGTIYLLIILIGTLTMNVEVNFISILISTGLGIILASALHGFDIMLDYSRIEYSSFEDDDYYYYVKAVPKISLNAPDRKVKTINSRTDNTKTTVVAPETRPSAKEKKSLDESMAETVKISTKQLSQQLDDEDSLGDNWKI